ncbi:MAG: pyrroloquinoline quinone biosynthesis protein PqqB [Gammaproteobacteria bacterium]|nr:pyrroloquinoline quinone biosynthesis protein PqqB [Gammaproteobacteria bacterium]
MKIRVLGSAAGGGFPQWNCNCENCVGVRSGSLNAIPRTQSSIAISSDGVEWLLVNASPDIRQQILNFPALQPARTKRDSGIRAVLLIDSQIDHCTGLLMLRENHRPLEIYCSRMVYQDLTSGFPVLKMLEHYCGVNWHELSIDGADFEIAGIPGLLFSALPLTSKAPPYSPHRKDPHPGDNIGIKVQDPSTGSSLFYAPGLACIEPHLEPAMHAADLLLLDGTCWTDDEMLRRGVGSKRTLAMGHLPQSGSGGMMEALKPFQRQRKVLIHINNTNPMLVEDSAERAELSKAGIEVSHDGMEIEI